MGRQRKDACTHVSRTKGNEGRADTTMTSVLRSMTSGSVQQVEQQHAQPGHSPAQPVQLSLDSTQPTPGHSAVQPVQLSMGSTQPNLAIQQHRIEILIYTCKTNFK